MGRALLDPTALLARAGLTLEQTYIDFGAGSLGHFSFAASPLVGPGGRVYAVDILKSSLATIEERVRHEQFSNVLTLWGDIEVRGGVHLADGSADVVALVNNVQLIKKSSAVLGEAWRLLRPGGRFLLIGWNEGGARFGIPVSKRLDPSDVIGECARAGFVERERFSAGPNHWGLLFERPPSTR